MAKTKTGTWNRGKKSPYRGKRLPPEPLSAEEVESLIRACSNRAPTGVRNRALIVVLWRGGLRIGEALALKPKDLDPEAGTIRVLHGKGDKSRLVGLDAGAWSVLQRWLDKRKELKIDGRRRVFCTLQGKPLQPQYVRELLPRLARKVGLDKRVHPHGLRHTHACELRQEGLDLGIISKQLGHASVATTSRYLDHIHPQAVVDAIRSREWSLDKRRSGKQ
jgi:site-specific recombinase XerD